MQLGTMEEVNYGGEDAKILGDCLYCGQAGHQVAGCPAKNRSSVKEKVQVTLPNTTHNSDRPTETVSFLVSGSTIPQTALVDSGVDASFMDSNLARSLGQRSVPLVKFLKATALDGASIWEVTHQPSPIIMILGKDHKEEIPFFEFSSSSQPVILGYPWHNPQVNSITGEVTFNTDNCKTCMPQNSALLVGPLSVYSVIMTSKRFSAKPGQHHCLLIMHMIVVLICYQALLPPKGRLYSLTIPETQAMREYIQMSLEVGIIRPSSSPAGARFFFVRKKDKCARALTIAGSTA